MGIRGSGVRDWRLGLSQGLGARLGFRVSSGLVECSHTQALQALPAPLPGGPSLQSCLCARAPSGLLLPCWCTYIIIIIIIIKSKGCSGKGLGACDRCDRFKGPR